MYRLSGLLATLATIATVQAHTVITYPGWRGNNLHTNGSSPTQTGSIGIDYDPSTGDASFPYGMQWMYPCGGVPITQNRTKWPVHGGGLAVQPGWFQGHSLALFYVNIGINEPGMNAPPNMSHPVVPPFQVVGPRNTEYPGSSFCIPQIGMPANLSLQIGTNITLQVIELAQHGAALYSCVDLTLADPSEVEPITPQNCINSTDLSFNLMYTMSEKAATGAAMSSRATPIAMVLGVAIAALLL
nr:hypothetical protein B0A51_13999 [Rachicladosporium sp. CCFEE 5018]